MLRILMESAPRADLLERIKAAIANLPGIDLGAISIQRAKVLVGVNAPDKKKARRMLASPDFASAIQATVTPLRKTIATGFSVQVDDPSYGKPVFIRIRSGGVLGRGIGNEEGLVATIQAAIQEGIENVLFKDEVGGSIFISDVVSVRRVGNDAGSRMGNRGDMELIDSKGKAHRISIKKDNASGVAGLIKFLKTRRLRIQKDLKPLIQSGAITLPATGLISVPVRNPVLFKYCWFGNDIDEGGGVVIGNFEGNKGFTLDEKGDTVVVNCLRAFSPKDNLEDLMDGDLTGVYLLMRVNARPPHHMDIIGARNRRMAGKYEIPNFEIADITSEGTLTLGQLRRLLEESSAPFEPSQERGFRPTVEWMKEKYTEMNKWLFDGKLGSCEMGIFTHGQGSEGRTLGKFRLAAKGIRVSRASRRMYMNDSWMTDPVYIDEGNFVDLCNPTILLNGNYSGTERAFLATLVHEMCHYYTYRRGWCPLQGHGREFKAIAARVSAESGGLFTIQRLASAEDMSEYDLDDEFKAKKDRRLANKKDAMKVLLVITKSGEARLTLSKSDALLEKITKWGEEHPGYAQTIKTDSNKALDFLFAKGYTKAFRTWRWWNIQDRPWYKDFKKLLDDLPKDEKEDLKYIEAQPRAIAEEQDDPIEVTEDAGFIEIDPTMDLGAESPLEDA